jgi:GxxExxY protein
LKLLGFTVDQQHRVPVYYEGIIVGDFVADLIVERQIIVELKVAEAHNELFTAQCLNYLRATRLPICLLLNFGKPSLDIKRYAHRSFAT